MRAATYSLGSTAPPEAPVSLRTPEITLAVLARRAADGDDDAFDTLYNRLDGGLRRFLTRRGVSAVDVVEELAQLTWVDVWQALRDDRYDPARAAITTFLYAVGYKVWLQHRRQLRSGPARDTDADVLDRLAMAGADPGDVMDLAARIQRIRECIDADRNAARLSIEEHAVVTGLCGGESERILAERLRIAASTVHARKTTAFQKIRNYMDLHDDGPRTGERGRDGGG